MTKDRKIFKLSYVLCISLLGLLCIVGTLATSNSVNAQTISESQVETSGLATLFWTKLLRTRNYFNYSSYPADFRVFNPLYSTGVR